MTRLRTGLRQWKTALPFILPGLILVILFSVYPIFQNARMSITNFNVLTQKSQGFVGFTNYVRAASDPVVVTATVNTIVYALVCIPIEMLLGLFIAALLHSGVRGNLVYRALCYLPVITSWVIVSLIFRYLFSSGQGGLVNYLLGGLGLISAPVAWLSHRWTAFVAIWSLEIWKSIGWVMVIYLAGLQGVPKALYEAARIDGSGWFNRLRFITVPLLRPVTVYILVNRVIGAFSAFISIYMITDGGPMNRTEVLLSYMYKAGFQYFEFSYASTLSMIMAVLILMFSGTHRLLIKEEK
ncbi:MAG: sugar ABC transporter permease [Spirochaetales bacterium]|nr:sugar ABC transporter permease [Spirochaetales bacterium]